ncbi:hypothetical protein [Shewanella sp. ALD9]|uniref:hypothetical protein n=1 Tax=Shewanella sp. ALD9 TaxID=2058330 RepID=UPI000C3409D6|nr:hypothetical protein [Shewanella sp. ALD9]PKH31450.1 hypothetical protein CXF88_12935 [Shewanella sp. ALD9]
MSDKKEAIFCFKSSNQNIWIDQTPSAHRKNHINYSQNTFTIIAYLMQRFELSQSDARQVLDLFFKQLGITTPVPSQPSVSRELKKYRRVLHGWKYVIINNDATKSECSIGVVYKKPEAEFYQLIPITTSQNDKYTQFKFNDNHLNLKRVSQAKTAPTLDRIILQSRNKAKEDEYAKSITTWLCRNTLLLSQVKYLIKSDGNKLFDSLIPLMPKLKDTTKKLLAHDHYTKLSHLPNKAERVKNALLKTNNTPNIHPQTTEHLQIQTLLFKYASPEIKVHIYRLAIWIYCPYSKLSFIRLHSEELVDKNELHALETNKAAENDYLPINIKKIVHNLKFIKQNDKLKFQLSFSDGAHNRSWVSYLKLSATTMSEEHTDKTIAPPKAGNQENNWDFDAQSICVGEKLPENKTFELAHKNSTSAFILPFTQGTQTTFSKNAFTKQLKAWLSYINESSQASPLDNNTYKKNKHMLTISE